MEAQEDKLAAAQSFHTFVEKRVADFDERRWKSRKHLYVASMITLSIAITGAVPKKIDAFGISFDPGEQRKGMILLVVVVAYFLFEYIYLSLRKELMYASGRGGFNVAMEEFLRHVPTEATRIKGLIKWNDRITRPAETIYEYVLPSLTALSAIILALAHLP